jgi:hypothetical protein
MTSLTIEGRVMENDRPSAFPGKGNGMENSKTCVTCGYWGRELSGASAQNPRAICLHHKNTHLYRNALERCELWKTSTPLAGGEEGAVETASPVVDAAVLAEREACARLVETNHSFMCGENARDMMEAARELANMIRGRT